MPINWTSMIAATTAYETADAKTAANALQGHIDNAVKAWSAWQPAWDACLAERVKANAKAKASVKAFQEWMVKNIQGAKWTVSADLARDIVAMRAHTIGVRSAFGKYCERTGKDEVIANYRLFLEGVDRGDYDKATGKDTKARTTRQDNAKATAKARTATVLESATNISFATVVVGKQYKEGFRQLLILEQNLGADIAKCAAKLTEEEADAIRAEVRGLVTAKVNAK